jgi:uncharacterized phage-associated protein
MRFVFNEQRAAQAAAHLLYLNGGTMNYMVLIKLLYYADRTTLIDKGQPITGDKMVSMPNGPVLSMIYDFINMGRDDEASTWFEYISEPQQYDVSLNKTNPETDGLSLYEIGVLDDTYEKYGRMNKWALRDLTHQLPEWNDPSGSSFPIDPKDILLLAGKSQTDIEQAIRDAEELWLIDSLERA